MSCSLPLHCSISDQLEYIFGSIQRYSSRKPLRKYLSFILAAYKGHVGNFYQCPCPTQDQLRHNQWSATQVLAVFKALQVIRTRSQGHELLTEHCHSKCGPGSCEKPNLFFNKISQVPCRTLKFEERCSNPFPRPHLVTGSSWTSNRLAHMVCYRNWNWVHREKLSLVFHKVVLQNTKKTRGMKTWRDRWEKQERINSFSQCQREIKNSRGWSVKIRVSEKDLP